MIICVTAHQPKRPPGGGALGLRAGEVQPSCVLGACVKEILKNFKILKKKMSMLVLENYLGKYE